MFYNREIYKNNMFIITIKSLSALKIYNLGYMRFRFSENNRTLDFQH